MTDIVNLTYGLNVGIFERTLLTFGVVTPVTSPKPFDFEVMAFVNYFFGPGPRRPTGLAAGAGRILRQDLGDRHSLQSVGQFNRALAPPV